MEGRKWEEGGEGWEDRDGREGRGEVRGGVERRKGGGEGERIEGVKGNFRKILI
jgi:hypothetical protein